MWLRIVDRMTFHPSPGADLTPGVAAEDVYLHAQDGTRIHAFFVSAPRGASRALLFMHGNAGNASHRLPNAAQLAELDTHVLLLDYRGYGLSEGVPSEPGLYQDARAALAHLIEERAIPSQRIALLGRSLGGAVAVELAVDRPLAGVILESTFTSLPDMGRRVAGPIGAFFARGRFESERKITRVRAPLLFFHGDRDEVVPYELGKRLYDTAPEPKAFETIDGAGHNDTVRVGGRAYYARIQHFLDEVAPPEG